MNKKITVEKITCSIMEVLLDKDGMTEAEYIKDHIKRNYPKPALTADVVMIDKAERKVLLIKRGGHPFIGCYAFPGGFADENEPIEVTAQRELEEETSVSGLDLVPFGFYSKPGRDPRGWTVTRSFYALVDMHQCHAKAGDDARETIWMDIDEARRTKLAFDHSDILEDALKAIGV